MNYKILGFAVAVVWPCATQSAPPPNSDPHSATAAWFKSLKQPNGASCCDFADCRPYPSVWRDGHWFITYKDKEVRVPDEVVDNSRFDNPTGHNIACVTENFVGYNGGDPLVMCFFPETGT